MRPTLILIGDVVRLALADARQGGVLVGRGRAVRNGAPRTYDHGPNVVDGRVWWRWSNGEGSMRPEYRTADQ